MRNPSSEWIFPSLVDIPANFQAEFGGSSLFNQTLFRRGFQTIQSARGFLNTDYYHPASPTQLPGLSNAVDRILEAFKKNQNILVWGDFDVDGQTSTTLLVSALSGHGSKIFHYIPNRALESHGVSTDTLQQQIIKISPSVLLTCDTGIDAIEPVAYAQSSGIDVIITDHHQLPPDLPPAHSIINPNMLSEDHPLFNLPGVGVAYKLIEYLYSDLHLNPEKFLDLVALGIVADVALQTHDTRYLLQKGLTQLQNTSRLGLQHLLSIANSKSKDITEETIGFVIGPRLNALGRLDDANSCVEFFTTTDPARAAELAQQLESLNSQRQILTEKIFQDTIKMITDYPEYAQDYPVLVLQGPSQWHPGVIGIVASRLVERFHKPVIMLSQDGNLTRGSARSIPGVPISTLISKSANLLLSFGGHPMAAGVTLALENVTQFRRDLSKNYERIVGGLPITPAVNIDGDLPFQSISDSFIKDFKRLAPFGAGNPKLMFATRGVHLGSLGVRTIGKEKKHKKITLVDSSGTKQDLLWWNSADIELPNDEFDIAYSLDLTTYKNQLQVQATLRHFREPPISSVIVKKEAKTDLLDFRSDPGPNDRILSYASTPGLVIWAEFNSPEGVNTLSRLDLHKSDTLIIWTTPPSREVFNLALHKVKPRKIIFFAVDPEVQTLTKFITKLHGLLKTVIDSDIRSFDVQTAAQSLSVTPALIKVGLDWIHFHGDYDLSLFISDLLISPGPRENLDGFSVIDSKLKFLLKDIAAYRSYFSKTKLDALL